MTYRIMDRNDPDYQGTIFGADELQATERFLRTVKPLADIVGVDFYIMPINTP